MLRPIKPPSYQALLLLLSLLHTLLGACPAGQYDANGVCTNCHVTCKTCTFSTDTSCSTCDSTRYKTSQTSCHCNDGYVEKSPIAATCQQLSCHYSCKTCNNTVSTCTSCQSSHQRVYASSSSTCPCIDKYYDPGVGQCASCHYSCGKCTAGNAINQCTFCDSYSFRTLSSGKCNCNAQFYDIGVHVCAECSYVCATCSGSAASCDTCGANRGAKPTCACLDSFWDDGHTTACLACDYSCKTCVDGTSCSSCDSTKQRHSSSLSLFCTCMDRYYDTGTSTEQCSACNLRCMTCITSSTCLTCNQTAFRTFNSNNNFCDCQVGYYQTSTTTELCARCDSRCYTCSVAAANCTSCDGSKNRQLSGNTCPCKTGFWQNAFITCTACHQSCYSCTGSQSCTGCVASTLKVVNSSGYCDCAADKYYNTASAKCETCNYKCTTCSTSDWQHCLTCPTNSNSHRTFNANQCLCDNHYWDNGVTNCASCHYSCLTCSSSSLSACQTCTDGAHRTLSSNKCICKTKYYDKSSFELCQPCLHHCLTCTNATECVSCDLTLHRVITSTTPKHCECKTYYFQAADQLCYACRYDCDTCNTLTTCLTCSSPTHHRVFNSTSSLCDCQDHFYDNFVDRQCLACLPQCLTCTNSTKCTSCDSVLERTLSPNNRCPCNEGLFQQGGVCVGCLYHCQDCDSTTTCTTCNSTAKRILDGYNLCVCTDNYFDDKANQECVSCSYACLTCVDTAIKCVSCDTTLRQLDTNWCACPQYFWDNNQTVACQQCQYTCSTCRNLSKCHSCNSTMKRQYDTVNQYCQCMEGWYDDGSNTELCPQCNYRCKSCTNSTQCLTCSHSSFRNTPTSMCPCLGGYYDDGISHVCKKCHYTCHTCTNSSECASCESPTYRRIFDNSNNLCKCQDRYYDDSTNQLCLPCIYSCLTCQTASSTCRSCNSTAYRKLVGNNCDCLQRFYDNLAEHCLPCHYSCLTCIRQDRCTSCDAIKHRQTNLTSGLCACMDRWWDDGLKEDCEACHASCLTCNDTTRCITCDPTQKRRLNDTTDLYNISSPFCVCFYRHWAASHAHDCEPCHYSCQVCTDASNTSCVYCNATSLRTFSQSTTSCLCNDGYFDDGSNQLCQPCHQYCALCTTALPNSCSRCTALIYHLAATTTCYSTCPNYYFDYQLNFTCQECSQYCLKCLNQTYCSKCQGGKYLYQNACYATCPVGTYNDDSIWICIDCPNGCKSCPNHTKCYDCFEKFYYVQAVQFCSSCHPACQTCSGPGISQCLTCASPLTKKSGTCIAMSCPSGTYVHPQQGCVSCDSLFSGSATCNATLPFSCGDSYKLVDNTCVACRNVDGFRQSKGECVEECGDGKLFYLQCDDGNNDDGDGCSSNCLIEKGWVCTVASPSQCSLKNAITLSFYKFKKVSGQNKVIVYLLLSLPVRIKTGSLTLVIEGVSQQDYEAVFSQNPKRLDLIQVEITYWVHLQKTFFSFSYSESRRLLESQPYTYPGEKEQVRQPRHLISLSFSSSFTLDTYPPANYYEDSTFSTFKRIRNYLTAFSIGTLILGWILIPKRMHLHALSVLCLPAQIFIMFGLSATGKSDWLQYTLGYMWRPAMMSGWSTGDCCDIISDDHDITSQIFSAVGLPLVLMVGGWIVLGLFGWLQRGCCEGMSIKGLAYFVLTATLGLFFPVTYAATNALYHFSLQTPADSFNTNLGVILTLFFPFMVLAMWFTVYRSQSDTQAVHSKTTNQIHIEQKDQIVPLPSSETSSEIDYSSSSKRHTFYQSEVKTRPNSSALASAVNQREDSLLPYDYQSLYSSIKIEEVEGRKVKVQTKAKYYLPLLFTKLYLIAILASYMQGTPFPFFILAAFLQTIFLFFLIGVRPFLSSFTNFRIIFSSLFLLTAEISFTIYLYHATQNDYKLTYQYITAYSLLVLMGFVMVFFLLQHIMAWKEEIWKLVEPCLKGSRLMGTRKMAQFDLAASSDQMSRTLMKSTKRSFMRTSRRGQSVPSDLQEEEMDAFYARMLKRDELNRRYRRERHLR